MKIFKALHAPWTLQSQSFVQTLKIKKSHMHQNFIPDWKLLQDFSSSLLYSLEKYLP